MNLLLRERSSLERFRAAKALFYWWESGVGREKKKSMILGTTLQKCQREVQTSKWLFVSYCQWLNMNAPFPYDPGLADDLLVHDFHFISSHWHEDRKSTLRSKLRWNNIVRGWDVHLETYRNILLCTLPPKDPKASLFPNFTLPWKPLTCLGCCQGRETFWNDVFWPFLPFCLHRGNHDFLVLSSLLSHAKIS